MKEGLKGTQNDNFQRDGMSSKVHRIRCLWWLTLVLAIWEAEIGRIVI
jgi:hypothetical protein